MTEIAYYTFNRQNQKVVKVKTSRLEKLAEKGCEVYGTREALS